MPERTISRARGIAALFAMALGSIAHALESQDASLVERGRYLVVAADCVSCHTAQDGGQSFAGGRAIETPFGTIIAPNITPDRETGIGAWDAAQFDAALRRGIRRDGARLYPAMPYPWYTQMSRDDVDAIRAYLSTVPASRTGVTPNTLPFPFNVRTIMRLWDALYFDAGSYQPDLRRNAAWNRGAYLVRGPGHCGACHTPKSILGGDRKRRALQGYTMQGWHAPDITGGAGGIGRWSRDELVAFLGTGHNDITAATGSMAEVVSLSTSHLSKPDLQAIAEYLGTLRSGNEAAAPMNPSNAAMVAGAAIYRDQCSACHGLEGQGVPRLFPALAYSALARARDPTTLIRIVLRGARSVATDDEPTAPGMPAYGARLNDAQVAAVLDYVRNAWGRAASIVTPGQVTRARTELASRPD